MRLVQNQEAAAIAGVSRQTIVNWMDRGVLTVHKLGKAHYVDADTITAMGDLPQDVERTRQMLSEERTLLRQERQAMNNERDLRRWRSLCIESSLRNEFFKSVCRMLVAVELLTEREATIMQRLLDGDDIEDVSNDLGLTCDRIRQIAAKSVRKSAELIKVADCIRLLERDKVELERQVKSLKNLVIEKDKLTDQLRLRREEIEKVQKAVERDEMMRDIQTRDEDLFLLLATPINECGFTPRTQHCLKAADIKAVGDLVRYNATDLLKFRYFGKVSLEDVNNYLSAHGLRLGIDVGKLYEQRLTPSQ